MNNSDRELLETAFAAAVSLEGAERDTYVDEFATQHPAMAGRLRSLLQADNETAGPWQRAIESSVMALSQDMPDPWVGRTLGVYTLKERIGAGGMSTVFLADRTDVTYAQSVAVKIMSAQLFSDTAIDRFRTERQILASLNHPHIATLIDGGSTEENLPYLVMEHVSGTNVDSYCDTQHLSIEARIKLFQKICAAIDYAHRNMIVHRDLKPSNILIGADGVPKLLDFGIAKLIDPQAQLHEPYTAVNMRVLTPEYASPEQIQNQAISVASDVYALGVLLFKLLTGRSPYGAKPDSIRELESAIVEHDPLKPSVAVASTDDPSTADAVATQRATTAAKLRQTLAGDLDNIVLKCLQKEPERRYVSALALAQDLDRFLNNEPVEAHGGDWLYKLKKFSVRQAKLLSLAAVALVALVSLTTYYTWQLSVERNQALQAADEAQRAASRAQEVANFLQSLFASASPVVAQGKEITALDLLDAGVGRIDQLDDQPLLQAELLRVMGGSYGTIGSKERSFELFDRSIATLEATPNLEPVVLAEALLHHCNNLRVGHDYEQAEQQCGRALQLLEDADAADTHLYAQLLGVLGSTLNDLGRFAEGETLLLRARDIFVAQPGPPSNDLLLVLSDYANALSSQSRTADALLIFKEITETSDVVVGPLHPDSIVRRGNLAAVARRIGEFELADQAAAEALARGREVWTRENPQLMRHMALASASAANMGRFAEALELGEQAVDWLQGTPWVNSSHDFVARVSLGRLYKRTGAPEKGAVVLKALLDDAIAMLGDKHYLALSVQLTYADALTAMGQLDTAEQLLREIAAHGDGLPRFMYLDTQQTLANTLSLNGQVQEADALFSALLDQLDETVNIDQPIAVTLLPVVSSHYRRSGQFTEAIEVALRALAVTEQAGLGEHFLAARAMADLSLARAALGQVDAVTADARRAWEVLSALFSAEDEQLRALAEMLGEQAVGA